MRQLKFKYYFENARYGGLYTQMFTLKEISEGYIEEFLNDHIEYKIKYKCQFTELFDKDGVEIYEGDIIIITEYDYDDFGEPTIYEPVEVVWKRTQWMFDNHKHKVLGEYDWTDYANLATKTKFCDFEVIGNIYKNPELLKEDNV